MHGVGVVLTFVRVLLVCFGELAVLCSLVFARVRVTVLGFFLHAISSAPWISGFPLQFMLLHLHLLEVLQYAVFGAFCSVLLSFSVFFPPSSPLIIVVLFSPLKSQFSVMGALAGAGCGWWGLWLGCR